MSRTLKVAHHLSDKQGRLIMVALTVDHRGNPAVINICKDGNVSVETFDDFAALSCAEFADLVRAQALMRQKPTIINFNEAGF